MDRPRRRSAERRRHASVLNYWLSIRGDKEFPPLHDLDPLEISDAGPNSALLELISGGHDAEIRHLGEALRDGDWPERVIDADNPSILACIAKKLPIVAISRDFLAFEDEFSTPDGKTRCWVTLLPLSAGGAWVDYVYAFVSFESAGGKPAKAPKKPVEEEAEVVEEATADVEEPAEIDAPDEAEIEEPVVAVENEPEEPAETPPKASAAKGAPGFSKLLEGLGLGGFYAQGVKVEPVMPADLKADEPVVEEVVEEEPALDESQAEEISELKPAVEEPPVEDVAEEQPVFEQPPTEEIAEVRPKQPDQRIGGNLAEQTYRRQGQGRRSPDGQAPRQCRPLRGARRRLRLRARCGGGAGRIFEARRGAGTEDPAPLADEAGRQARLRRACATI